MGTRAVIRMNGKFMLATHWDGYPDSLGKELVKLKDKSSLNVVQLSAEHNIDSIHKDFVPKKSITTGQDNDIQTTVFKKSGTFSGGTFIRGEEGKSKKISSIIDNEKQYGDWAEYIYDIRNGDVYVAEGHGDYSSTLNAEKEGNLKWKLIGKRKITKNIQKLKGKKGWKNESVRHSLSSKGIKTGRKKR